MKKKHPNTINDKKDKQHLSILSILSPKLKTVSKNLGSLLFWY